jgi:O-succinylbenzoic acid--CoA ligase
MDGYFPTNDRGYIENNLLYLTGRMDKMFISGGENIHPEEIEGWLHRHCSCAIVVPIDHERYGKRPVAFIHQPQKTSLEFREYLLEHLAKFKVPDHFYLWPSDIPLIKPPRKILEQLAQQGIVRTID